YPADSELIVRPPGSRVVVHAPATAPFVQVRGRSTRPDQREIMDVSPGEIEHGLRDAPGGNLAVADDQRGGGGSAPSARRCGADNCAGRPDLIASNRIVDVDSERDVGCKAACGVGPTLVLLNADSAIDVEQNVLRLPL